MWSRREATARYSRTALRTFADRAPAELLRADATGEDLYVDLTRSDTMPGPTG